MTALTFNYKDNCPTASSYNFVQRILAARNTSTLQPILNEMESADTLITAGCESSPLYTTVQFSVRNNFFQANQTQVSGTNTVVTSYEPSLQGGTIVTNAAGSLAAWTNYLAANLITNEFGERVLLLNFSTSLNAQITGGLQRNPLFSCYTFGTTLYSGLDGNGNQTHWCRDQSCHTRLHLSTVAYVVRAVSPGNMCCRKPMLRTCTTRRAMAAPAPARSRYARRNERKQR